jgi:unsaturated rhamnogalacturonyl hydrolase
MVTIEAVDDLQIAKVKLAMLAMQRHAWEQGMAAQALLELGETSTVIVMAREAATYQAADGRLALVASDNVVTDPAANGEPVLHAARRTSDPLLQQAADRMLHYLLVSAPRTSDGTLCHITDKRQVWVDSMYMAPPFMAVAGHPSEAVQQIEGMRRLLWDEGKQLFSHIWDDEAHRFERKDAWGVGNGWAVAGMTRVIRALPPEMEDERNRLCGCVRQLIDSLLRWQRGDGLFHNVVDDSSTFAETNLAQMLAYSIFRGVKGGWLPDSHLGTAERMRQAAHGKVDKFGLVQGVCGAPTFDHAGTATEGQAFFLLMEAAARDV